MAVVAGLVEKVLVGTKAVSREQSRYSGDSRHLSLQLRLCPRYRRSSGPPLLGLGNQTQPFFRQTEQKTDRADIKHATNCTVFRQSCGAVFLVVTLSKTGSINLSALLRPAV